MKSAIHIYFVPSCLDLIWPNLARIVRFAILTRLSSIHLDSQRWGFLVFFWAVFSRMHFTTGTRLCSIPSD